MASLTTGTLTGTFTINGVAATGTVTLTPTVKYVQFLNEIVIVEAKTVTLNGSGAFSTTIASRTQAGANGNPDIMWTVTTALATASGAVVPEFTIAVTPGQTLDLSAAVPVSPNFGEIYIVQAPNPNPDVKTMIAYAVAL